MSEWSAPEAPQLGSLGLLGLLGAVDDPARLLPALERWLSEALPAGVVRVHLASEDGRMLERFGPDAGPSLGLHEQLAGRAASRGTPQCGQDAAGASWTAVPVRDPDDGLTGVIEAGGPAPTAPRLEEAATQVLPLLVAARRWRFASRRLDAAERFAERAIAAQEAERARLAREIHDGVAQRLAGLGFQLSAAASLVGVDDEALGRRSSRRAGCPTSPARRRGRPSAGCARPSSTTWGWPRRWRPWPGRRARHRTGRR